MLIPSISTEVNFEWKPPSDSGGSLLLEYEIYIKKFVNVNNPRIWDFNRFNYLNSVYYDIYIFFVVYIRELIVNNKYKIANI